MSETNGTPRISQVSTAIWKGCHRQSSTTLTLQPSKLSEWKIYASLSTNICAFPTRTWKTTLIDTGKPRQVFHPCLIVTLWYSDPFCQEKGQKSTTLCRLPMTKRMHDQEPIPAATDPGHVNAVIRALFYTKLDIRIWFKLIHLLMRTLSPTTIAQFVKKHKGKPSRHLFLFFLRA